MSKNVTLAGLTRYNSNLVTKIDARFAQKATSLSGYGITDAYTKDEVDAKMTSAYKAKGTIAASGLVSSLLVAANEGNVYNLSDTLTITSSNKALFVENAEGSYPKGSNVVIVEATPADNSDPENPVEATYKFDVLPGFVDLSNYATLSDVEEATNAEIDAITSGTWTE